MEGSGKTVLMFSMESVGWRIAEAVHCRQGIYSSIHRVPGTVCGFTCSLVHILVIPACNVYTSSEVTNIYINIINK